MEFSRCARIAPPAESGNGRPEGRPVHRSLKAQQPGRHSIRSTERRGRRFSRRVPLDGRPRRAIDGGDSHGGWCRRIPRKEVIQPQLPLRLPCYDFTPITDSTFGRCLLAVGPRTSGVSGFRGVTGGVYKARERIHRGVADPRLLATPTSWRRVSASNPNWDRLFGIRSTSRSCSPLNRPL